MKWKKSEGRYGPSMSLGWLLPRLRVMVDFGRLHLLAHFSLVLPELHPIAKLIRPIPTNGRWDPRPRRRNGEMEEGSQALAACLRASPQRQASRIAERLEPQGSGLQTDSVRPCQKLHRYRFCSMIMAARTQTTQALPFSPIWQSGLLPRSGIVPSKDSPISQQKKAVI